MDTKKVKITRTTVMRGIDVIAQHGTDILTTLPERRAAMRQRYGQDCKVYLTCVELKNTQNT